MTFSKTVFRSEKRMSELEHFGHVLPNKLIFPEMSLGAPTRMIQGSQPMNDQYRGFNLYGECEPFIETLLGTNRLFGILQTWGVPSIDLSIL